ICADCYSKQLQASAVESSKILPVLTGTEKQIAWAETIRSTAVNQLKMLKGMIDTSDPESHNPLGIIDNEIQQNDSGYWIDNRNSS
ncbi:hypothetical protein, partial [Shewanella xiamenensis]|uniref:hypothetical protein n=1 Tax=Shewanella xiamenensis TaxID=332186 RepID=UPI0024A66EB5